MILTRVLFFTLLAVAVCGIVLTTVVGVTHN
jgi:hypothetical protein